MSHLPIYLSDSTTSQGDSGRPTLLINDQRQLPPLAVVAVQCVNLDATVRRSHSQLGRVEINSIPKLHNPKRVATGKPLLSEGAVRRGNHVGKPDTDKQRQPEQHT